jgi:hypothetical protein
MEEGEKDCRDWFARLCELRVMLLQQQHRLAENGVSIPSGLQSGNIIGPSPNRPSRED